MTTTPSASDLAKLFIALGEQTKGWAQARPSTFVPISLIEQFNILADAANEIADIKIPRLLQSSSTHTAEAFLV